MMSALIFANDVYERMGFWGVGNKILILFYLTTYNRYLRKNIQRIWFILIDSAPLLLGYAFIMVLSAAVGRLLLYDSEFTL